MTLSLILALCWLVLANVIGALPSKHHHWPSAYGLIAVGLPLLAFVFWENGIWIGLVILLMACSILRCPVLYMFRWFKRVFGLNAHKSH